MTLVLLHGFSGHGGSWAEVAARFPGALTPNLPGHAGEPMPADYDLWAAADDLAARLPATFDLVGYSLGGRIALHLALAHPARINRLVLIGVSAGVPDPAARMAEDEVWARKLEVGGLPAFVDAWEARPLFASRRAASGAAAARAARLQHHPADLARALRAFSPGRQDDLRARLSELAMPTLWLAGEHDAKFVALARELAPACRRGQAAVVPGSGHDVPLERPEALTRLLRDFLSSAAPILEEAL